MILIHLPSERQTLDWIDETATTLSNGLLHFARVVDDAKCILVTRICLSVCLSAAVFTQYCTDPDVTCGNGRGCPLVVHYWTVLVMQSVHGLRCYHNIARMRNVSDCLYSLYKWLADICKLLTGGQIQVEKTRLLQCRLQSKYDINSAKHLRM